MSIIIKGMEMPKAGDWKTIRIYYDGTCAEPNWQGDCKYIQSADARQLKPHGRLIDADALMRAYLPHEFSLDMGDAMEMLENAPTIIEAEEDDE